MGEVSKIAWTDATFNPWIGCARVSPGCEHCYAEAMAKRMGAAWAGVEWGVHGSRSVTSLDYWRKPLTWNAKATKEGRRVRVFCASLADVFEDRPELMVPRARLFALIAKTSALDWLLLTKRPENMVRLAPESWAKGWPDNVWAGTTVEDQKRADERIPWLVEVPARVRFLSCEPLLEAVDLTQVHPYYLKDKEAENKFAPRIRFNCLTGHYAGPDDILEEQRIQWVIVGGESGPKSRAFDVRWARDIVRACSNAKVPVFVKQLGANPIDSDYFADDKSLTLRDPKGGDSDEWPAGLHVREFPIGAGGAAS